MTIKLDTQEKLLIWRDGYKRARKEFLVNINELLVLIDELRYKEYNVGGTRASALKRLKIFLFKIKFNSNLNEIEKLMEKKK